MPQNTGPITMAPTSERSPDPNKQNLKSRIEALVVLYSEGCRISAWVEGLGVRGPKR